MKRKFMFVAMMAAMCSTALFTSCVEETTEELAAEQMAFNNLTALANADGTITIGGEIVTNTKIKEFCLYNADGSVAYDFLKDNEQVKQKNDELDDNGKAVKNKQFSLQIASKTLPVAMYTMEIKTKKSATFSEAIGAEYSFNVGTGANTQLGSQISLRDQKCYMLGDFYKDGAIINDEVAASIEIMLQSDLTIASAQNLKIAKASAEIAAKLADAKVYPTAVITTTDCIATYTVTPVDEMTVKLSGIVINSKGTLKIDTSAAFGK